MTLGKGMRNEKPIRGIMRFARYIKAKLYFSLIEHLIWE